MSCARRRARTRARALVFVRATPRTRLCECARLARSLSDERDWCAGKGRVEESGSVVGRRATQ